MRLSIVAFIFMSFLMTACGFQLRGLNHNLSQQFSAVYMQETDNQAFQEKIKKLITANGGQLVAKDKATIALYVSPVTVSSRQISLSSSGSLKEYERTYQTKITIVNITDQTQLGSRSITNTQYLQLDDLSPQAGEEQSKISLTAAENDLAQAVMSYLSTF